MSFLGVDDEVLRSLVEGVEAEARAPEPVDALSLTVAIGVIRLSVAELCRVAVGDLLPIEEEQVSVQLEGVHVLRGNLALAGEKIFLRVSTTELDGADMQNDRC